MFFFSLDIFARADDLTVTGVGRVLVKATISEVRLGIEIEGKTSSEVQQAVAARLSPLLEKLKSMQVDKLQTSVVNVYSQYNNETPPALTGYRGRIDIAFEADTNKAPSLIDAAFKAGANQLVNLSLRPTATNLHEARLNALKEACDNALIEAKTVLDTLGLQSKRIVDVKIQPQQELAQAKNVEEKTIDSAFKTATSGQILEQEQPVHAAVSLVIELKEAP